MLRRKIISAALLSALLLPTGALAQTNALGTTTQTAAKTSVAIYQAPKETIDKIRKEGLGETSQVMQTLSYLTDVIGPRLTNSPGMKRANEWTRDTMAKWGMQNAKLVSWGPWGRGWSLKSFTAQVVSPQPFTVIAYPKAWTTSTKGAVTSDVVFLDAKTEAELDKFKGKLSGKIVLLSPTRELKAEEKALSERLSPTQLKEMADETDPNPRRNQPQLTDEQRRERQAEQQRQFLFNLKRGQFLLQEGAAVIVDNSSRGSGGTLFVQSASVVQDIPADITTFNFRNALAPYKKEAEAKIIPQMTMATEDYNRLVRMISQNVTPRMTVDINAQYHDEDQMGYNTIAEIPGTDPKLKDEVVMLGGHLDSWHSSTGATDNAAGCAVAMEAARILIASGLKPRRTIRVALWSGEEQGLNGSREYVKQVFGEVKGGPQFGQPNPNGQKPELVKTADYDKLSAYYNLDNGTGKIRGVYLQGNSAVKPIFETWLAPFADLGASTLTILNTSGTDHLSFDRIGLPGFQFIQDEVEYDTRTHHSNQDNYDRIQPEDMKQASTIMAAFVYQTAMMDEKLPRKTMP